MIRPPRHRGAIIFMIFVLFVMVTLFHRSRYLLRLLIENGGSDAVYPSEVPSVNNTYPHLIPKIIHQTYKTEEIPRHWQAAQKAVKGLHPDYEYMFWTDEAGLEFIKTRYPYFLSSYLSYPYPIQRVDALRYFLLHHYGGIYLDLDLVPYRSFTPLLGFPALACLTTPTGISNDVLFSTPGHPFFTLVLEQLDIYNRNLLVPYITVMYTTGPLFLSAIWIEYLHGTAGGGTALERLRVLVKSSQPGDSYGFVKNIQGGSWHGSDLPVIFWIRDHWIIVTLLGLLGLLAALAVVSLLWAALTRWWERQKLEYL